MRSPVFLLPTKFGAQIKICPEKDETEGDVAVRLGSVEIGDGVEVLAAQMGVIHFFDMTLPHHSLGMDLEKKEISVDMPCVLIVRPKFRVKARLPRTGSEWIPKFKRSEVR